MNCVVLTWIGENQDNPRNPPACKWALPARNADTYPPDGKPVLANAYHIVLRMRVAAVAVASVAVHRIAVVGKPDAVTAWAVVVPATLSAVGSAVRFEAVRPSVVAAFEAVAYTAVPVAAVAMLASAVAEPVPAVVARNLP